MLPSLKFLRVLSGFAKRYRALLAVLAVLMPALSLALPFDFPQGTLPAFEAGTEAGRSRTALGHYRKGLENLVAGRLDEAGRNFSASLQADPAFVASLLGLAEIDFRRNDPAAARVRINQALVLDSANPYVRESHGRLLYLEGDDTGAAEVLRSAIAAEPALVSAHVALADLYMSTGRDPAQAVEHYQAAIDIEPAHAGAFYGLGQAMARLGRNGDAVAMLRKAGDLQPANPLPAMAEAAVHREMGDERPALVAYGEALRRQPRLAAAHVGRAEVLQAAGNVPAAIDEYLAAVDDEPRNAEIQLRLGMAYQQVGNPSAARNAYLRAVELAPDLAVAYNNLAWLASGAVKDTDRALEWARKAVELLPGDANAHDTLGWVHHVRGEYDAAVAAYRRALDIDTDNALVRLHLALTLAGQGAMAQSSAMLDGAVERDPGIRDTADYRALRKRLESR